MTFRGARSLRMMMDTEDSQYGGLKKLKLTGRDLVSLPPDLFHIHELQVLDASPEREACLFYKISEIPSAIGRLINLRVLLIDTNDLRALPPEIGNLTVLQRLAISNNQLTNLPSEFSYLKNLRSLHMANNCITDFPEQICALEELEFLDMSDNQLTSVSPNISNLKKLESLMLFENQIECLPDAVCELVELRCLWLGNNRLRSLPRNFSKLRLLDWAWHYTSTTLDGNPLSDPPLDVCRMGVDEIEKYFKQNEQANEIPMR